jgi:hypothetical protein
LGRKNRAFDGAPKAAAALYTPIATTKLNDIDTQPGPPTC